MKTHLVRRLSLVAWVVCAGASVHAAGNAAASSGATNPGVSSAAASAGDRTFMVKAAGGGVYEVEVSKVADHKGIGPAVKEFASMLVKHHTEANNELMQLASSKGVTLPARMPGDKQAFIVQLSKLSDADFDREYLRRVGIDDHKNDIRLFEKGSRTARDPALKAWIDKTLPSLREHLAQAEKLTFPANSSASPGILATLAAGATGSSAAGAGGAAASRTARVAAESIR